MMHKLQKSLCYYKQTKKSCNYFQSYDKMSRKQSLFVYVRA